MPDPVETKPKAVNKILITRPEGCVKTSLSVDAMDARTRELAWNTHITINGDKLPCRSMKINDKGNLVLEIEPTGFELA